MRALLILPFLLAACSEPPPAVSDPENAVGSMGGPQLPVGTPTPLPAATPAPAATAAAPDYAGRWTGVEGMYLVVTPGTGKAVTLDMQWDLDNKGKFPGTVEADGIHFKRGDASLVLKPSDGDATGLKYLAGKRDCLTVASGEGYCRG